MRSAIVVGATGLVGSSLVRQLCENDDYIAVTAIVRRPLAYTHPKLQVKVRDFDTLAESDLGVADELFCCLGTTIKKAGSRPAFEQVDVEYPLRFAALAKACGIPHYIVISAMGASETSGAYYNRVKGKLEKELAALNFPQLSIVRPSLLVGKRAEFRLGERAGEAVLRIVNPLLVGPMKKFRSIQADQVARAMQVIALHGKKAKVAIYQSDELAAMQMPAPQEEMQDVVDEEVVFDRTKREFPPKD